VSKIQEKFQVIVSTPPAERLVEAECFVIGGIRYTVEPDVTGKVLAGNSYGQRWVRPSKGFAGRKFVIETFDGRTIVTRNIWMGESTDEEDNARFIGREAKPVNLRKLSPRRPWEFR
jgi:hypothetical protein